MRAPNGFRLKVVHDTVVSMAYESDSVILPIAPAIIIKLFHGTEEVGYVELVATRDGAWETHSLLDEEFRGRGLGILMYAKAIDVVLRRGQVVRSSHLPSADATRTWKSERLNELFKIRHDGGRFYVAGRKTQRHQSIQLRKQVSVKLSSIDVLL